MRLLLLRNSYNTQSKYSINTVKFKQQMNRISESKICKCNETIWFLRRKNRVGERIMGALSAEIVAGRLGATTKNIYV